MYMICVCTAQLDVIEDGFYDVGQLKAGSSLRTLEEYLQDPMHDKRPVFFVSAKQESVSSSSVTVYQLYGHTSLCIQYLVLM